MGIETNAYIFGWDRPVVGREPQAGELFGQTVGFFEKWVKAGKLESVEPVFVNRHGGTFNGFFFIKGTHANLEALANDDDFQEILTRGTLLLDGLGFIPAWRGAAVPELMAKWMKAIPR